MKKLLLSLFALIGLNAYGQGYVGEIINNTDEEIIVECKGDDASFCVIKSFLLKDNVEIQPKIQSKPAFIRLAQRTRNILDGLMIPMVNANDTQDKHGYCNESVIRISFPFTKYKNKYYYCCGYPYFLVRQMGDLLEFTNGGIDLNELHFPDLSIKKLPEGSPVLSFHVEKINNGKSYSIEINAPAEKLFHVKINGFTQKIKTTDLIRPNAQIVKFVNGTICSADIGFDRIVNDVFLNKFCDLIKNDVFFSRVSTMSIEDNGRRLLKFALYTKVNKEELQNIVDKLNQVPL